MRKLDKTEILASTYKEWQDGLVNGINHPIYNSSANRFYYDIIANLIWIQKGLCAYTETHMQAYEKCNAVHWKNGVFSKFNFAGELDHYDPTLKHDQGWLWDNFFLIDADVNSKKVKGTNIPNGLLKPDKVNFDPLYYLEYDLGNHIFRPSKERGIKEQAAILHDINSLGLNWQPTVERRTKYLNEKLDEVRYGIKDYDAAYNNLYQFFTAFELCKSYMLD